MWRMATRLDKIALEGLQFIHLSTIDILNFRAQFCARLTVVSRGSSPFFQIAVCEVNHLSKVRRMIGRER